MALRRGTANHRPHMRGNSVGPTCLLLLLLAPTLPNGLGQSPNPNLQIQEFNVPPSIVVGRPTTIVAVVENHGTSSNTGDLTLRHVACEPGPTTGIIRTVTLAPIDGGSHSSVQFTWDGRSGRSDRFGEPGNTPLRGNCLLELTLTPTIPEPADPTHQRNQSTLLIRYEPRLTPGDIVDAAPGFTAQQSLLVTNGGNADDTIDLRLENPTAGWRFSLSEPSVLLRPGESGEVFVYAHVPPNANRGDQGAVELVAASRNHDQSRARGAGGPYSALERFGVEVSTEPVSPLLLPGSRRNTVASVTNKGNDAETFQVQVTAPPDTVSATVNPAELAVARGETASTTITIGVPSDALAGMTDVRVRASSVTQPQVFAEAVHRVHVAQVYGVELARPDDPEGPVDVGPGQMVSIPLSVTNEGNGDDEIRFSASVLPEGWLTELSRTSILLAHGASAILYLNVTAPPAEPPENHTVRVTANSAGDPQHVAKLDLELAVPVLRNADLLAGTDRLTLDPEGEAAHKIMVRNTGNVRETFTLHAQILSNESLPATGWTVSFEPPSASLEPRATFVSTLKASAPEGFNEDSRASLQLRLRAAGDTQFLRAAPLLLVAPLPNLRVLKVLVPSKIYEGDTLLVNASVENDGDRSVTQPFDVRLFVENDQNGALLLSKTDRIATLGIGRMVNVSASVPTAQKKGVYTLRVLLDVGGNGGEVKEQLETDNTETRALQIHDAKLHLAAPDSLVARPGETVALQGPRAFRVQNQGSFTEEVIVSVSSKQGWLSLQSTAPIALGPGESRPLPLRVVLRASPGAASDVVEVRVGLSGTPRGATSNVTKVFVNDTVPPVIQGFDATPVSAMVGDAVKFTAEVSDDVEVRRVEVLFVGRDGSVQVFPLRRVGSPATSWETTAFMDQVGAFRFFPRAVDNSSRGNAVESRGVERTLVVRPNSIPNLRLVSPNEGSVVRSVDLVEVRAVDAYPLRRVWYTAGSLNRSMPVATAVRIPVKGWPEGAVLLSVFVESSSGALARRDFNFTNDNTPPMIGRVTTEALGGANGTRVVAQVLDADVAEARVAVHFVEGQPQLVPMKAVGNGTYEANLTFGGVVQSLVVTAVDRVGNVAHKSHPMVRPLAAPVAESPSPGLLAVVVALLAAFPWRARNPRISPRKKRWLRLLVFLLLLGTLVAGVRSPVDAQECPPGGETARIDAPTIIRTHTAYNCQRVVLAAPLQIASGGTLELGQSLLELRAPTSVPIEVQSGGNLTLHHRSQIAQASGSYTLHVRPGAGLSLTDSEVNGASELVIQTSSARLQNLHVRPASGTGIVFDRVNLTATGIRVTGGSVGVLVMGQKSGVEFASSTIGGAATAGVQVLGGARLQLESVEVSAGTSAATFLGASTLTARNSTLQAKDNTLLSLASNNQHPSLRFEGTSIDASRFQLAAGTKVELGWFVESFVRWGPSTPPGAVQGDPVPNARLEVRNASNLVQWTRVTDASGHLDPQYVKVSSWTGSERREHGPFSFLVSANQNAATSSHSFDANAVGAAARTVRLSHDPDSQAPGWDGTEAILASAAFSNDGSPTLTWRAATDHPTPDTPNRAVARYEVYRLEQNAPAGLVGTSTGLSFTDEGLRDGRYWYRVAPVDLAGNVGGPSNLAEVLVDRTPPQLGVRYNPVAELVEGNYSKPVRVEATATDAGSGLESLLYVVGTRSPATAAVEIQEAGFSTVRVEARDRAGNVATRFANVTLDSLVPRVNLRLTPNQADGQNDWYKQPPMLTVTGTDERPGTIYDLRYRFGGESWRPYTGPTRLSGTGLKDLHASARDAAGNTALTSQLVRIDDEAPTASVRVPSPDGENGWHRAAPTLQCDASDGVSGIFRVDRRTHTTDWAEVLGPFTLQSQGTVEVSCRATDAAGNTATSPSVPVRVDLENPLPPFVTLTRSAAGASALSADWAEDPAYDAGSGPWKYRLLQSVDGGPFNLLAEFSASQTRVALPPGNETNLTYVIEIVDSAGRSARSESFSAGGAEEIRPAETADYELMRVRGDAVLEARPPVDFDVAEAQFYLDGVLVDASLQPPYSYRFDSRAVPDGSHHLEIMLVSKEGLLYREARTLYVRNGYRATLEDQAALLAVGSGLLIVNVLAALVGVRRWLQIE